MKALHAMEAQLRTMGRCALVGALAGLLATQAVAATAPTATPQSSAKPETTSVPGAALTNTTTTNLPLTSYDSAQADSSGLPEAPNAATESASVTMPASLKAMMDDPAQSSQALTSTPSTQQNKVKPGWLALGIVGAGAMAMGAYIYSIKTNATGEKMALGTIFMAPGAAAAGLGFYFAFHQKN
jgi:hypothetical protein